MKKVLILIGAVIIITLLFWAPWVRSDDGEDLMENNFFRSDATNLDQQNLFQHPKGNCDCDGSCITTHWAPFGATVDSCSYDYYYVTFWGQNIYRSGIAELKADTKRQCQNLDSAAATTCYTTAAVKQSAPQICDLLGAGTDDLCMNEVYKAANDPSICEKISHPGVEKNCQKYYAQ